MSNSEARQLIDELSDISKKQIKQIGREGEGRTAAKCYSVKVSSDFYDRFIELHHFDKGSVLDNLCNMYLEHPAYRVHYQNSEKTEEGCFIMFSQMNSCE